MPDQLASSRTPPQHLPTGRADGAQQRHLAPALCDEDVEGVPDDEGAHQHRDAREHQQHGGEDAHGVAHRGGAVGGYLVPGQCLDVVGKDRRDPVAELTGAHAGLGLHVDLVDHAYLVEDPLGGGEVEARPWWRRAGCRSRRSR